MSETYGYTVTALDPEVSSVELSPAWPVSSCELYGLRFDDDELRGSSAKLYDLQSAPPWTGTFTCSLSPENWAAICRLVHSGHPLPLSRRRYSRCPVCNPRGNPGRLAIDGREYARRRKARKRR